MKLQTQRHAGRSEEIHEIFQRNPHWIVRRGNLIFLAVACIAVLACLYMYIPVITRQSARITTITTSSKGISTTVFVAEMKIPQHLLNKVYIGKDVRLELVAYPASHYGDLHGAIFRIADTACADNTFSAFVALPDSANRKFHLRHGLLATGILVTQKKNVFSLLTGK